MMENAKIGKSSNETFWVIFKHCVYVCDCYTLENGCYLGIQKRVSSSCYSSKLSVIGLKLNPFVHFIYHPAVKMTVKHNWKILLEIKLHELSFSYLVFCQKKRPQKWSNWEIYAIYPFCTGCPNKFQTIYQNFKSRKNS